MIRAESISHRALASQQFAREIYSTSRLYITRNRLLTRSFQIIEESKLGTDREPNLDANASHKYVFYADSAYTYARQIDAKLLSPSCDFRGERDDYPPLLNSGTCVISRSLNNRSTQPKLYYLTIASVRRCAPLFLSLFFSASSESRLAFVRNSFGNVENVKSTC